MKLLMKKKIALAIALTILLVALAAVFHLQSCKDLENNTITDGTRQYAQTLIPSFVKDMLGHASWDADTICVVNGKAYYFAYESYSRTCIIFDDERILAEDPTLRIVSYASGCKDKYRVMVTDKSFLVDFSDEQSLQGLSSLANPLPSFTRFRKDSLAEFGKTVFYGFSADFPKRFVPHDEDINKWLVEKVEESETMTDYIPPLYPIHIGNKEKPIRKWEYRGDIHNHEQVAKFASGLYFAITKGEYGTNYEDDYPSYLFLTLDLRARALTDRFVTYQEHIHIHHGGAHGLYTERLVSFDHVHKQEIDFDYLFIPESRRELLDILHEVAKNHPLYEEWRPNIDAYVCITDDDGNPTGEIAFPQPGLSDEGVVFSFQPYDISCFAAGTFHFTIPYDRVTSLLTSMGKWCLDGSSVRGGIYRERMPL